MDEAGPQAAARETTLGEVVRCWGDDYETRVRLDGPGCQASHRDGTGGPLAAETPGELWDLLTVDHASRGPGSR